MKIVEFLYEPKKHTSNKETLEVTQVWQAIVTHHLFHTLLVVSLPLKEIDKPTPSEGMSSLIPIRYNSSYVCMIP